MDPKTTWMIVTPALAEKWLEFNTHNRELRQMTVDRFVNDMRAGRWVPTHQGIGFEGNPFQGSLDTKLQDGQHRLWAIFTSGVEVLMPVTIGLPPEAMRGIDDHLPRTVTDVVNLGGNLRITNAHTAIASAMHRAPTNTRIRSSRISRTEKVDFLTRHIDAIDFTAREVFPTSTRGITAAVKAVVARAYYSAKPEELRAFGKMLSTGKDIPEEQTCVVILRNWLLNLDGRGQAGGGYEAREQTYRKTQRALWAFLHKQKIAKLFEAPEELFSIPGEQKR